MRSKLTKAIFPVAGLGTRFLPATKSIPKEIMTLVDRPLIQYAIDEARAAGITEFIFVTSRGKGALEDYFDHAPVLERELRKRDKQELLDARIQLANATSDLSLRNTSFGVLKPRHFLGRLFNLSMMSTTS